MVRVVAVLLLLHAAGCGGSEADRGPRASTLRVAAPYGLGEFRPGFTLLGSSAHALELGFDDFAAHASLLGREGRVVRLRLHGDRDDQTLAQAFEMEGVEFVELVGTRELRVTFVEQRHAERYTEFPELAGFALGPFRLDTSRPSSGLHRLGRRSGHGADAIEFVAMGATEQWRRLLARDIDLVPTASPLHRQRYDELDGVRVLEYPVANVMLLFFNTERLDRGTRVAIAEALDVAAIASAMCDGCEPWPAPPRAAATGLPALRVLPASLRIMVHRESDLLTVAARAVRLQLMEKGVDVSIQYVSLDQIVARMSAGDFDLTLMPRSLEEGWLVRRIEPLQMLTRYRPAELERAMRAGDDKEVRALIQRDLPIHFIAIYNVFAAVGLGWCGGSPKIDTNWKWLEELQPCETP